MLFFFYSQVQLLRLSRTIIILEDQLFTLKDDTDRGVHTDNEWEFYRIKYQSHNSSLAFIRSARFACQGSLSCPAIYLIYCVLYNVLLDFQVKVANVKFQAKRYRAHSGI